VHDLYHLGAWANGTATDSRTPITGLLLCMGIAAYFLGSELAPLPLPAPYSEVAWFTAQLALGLLLLALLHHGRPRGPDDPPRSFGESCERVVNPLFFGFVGLLVAVGCGRSYHLGTGGLGTVIFAVLGGMLALGGLAAAVHNVRRRL